MGLTRAIKTTHPNGRLLSLIDILEVRFKDMLHALLVLTVANKGFKLISEDFQGFLGGIIIDTGYTLIDQLPGGRVLQVDFSVLLHGHPFDHNSLSAVIGIAR